MSFRVSQKTLERLEWARILARLAGHARTPRGRARLAASGDPNAEGLPEWPAHDAETDRHLELGDRIVAGTALFKRECDLFDRIRAKKER